MRRWRGAFEAARDLAAEVEELTDHAARAERSARGCRDELAAHLTPLLPVLGVEDRDVPDGLAEAVKWAERAVEKITAAAERRAELTGALAAAAATLAHADRASDEANTALDTWRGWWERAVAPLALPGTPSAAEASAWLSAYDGVEKHRDRADRTRERVARIDRRAEHFAAAAQAAAARFAPDLAGRPPAEVAATLADRLDAARDRGRERGTLTAAVREAVAEFRSLSGDEGSSGGGDGADLRRDALAADPAALQAEVEGLEAELKALDAERDALNREGRDAEHALAALDTSGAAAEAEQRAQAVLAGISDDAERYARLKLADSLLTVAMERHRGRVQEPVLKHARRLFRRMTCGEFNDLRVEPGDVPRLVGVRSGGEEVPPGGMSDGTRDQLYFALRLAGLHVHLAAADPLPLVADDLLESFDDDRAAAALKALAELSEHTQVILLTHHRHLVTLARRRLPRRTLFVHDLVPAEDAGEEPAVVTPAQRSLIEVE